MGPEGNSVPERKFFHRSATSSICLSCFRTVSSDRPTSLPQAQSAHALVCQPLRSVGRQRGGTQKDSKKPCP